MTVWICPTCGGNMIFGTTDVTLQRYRSVLVVQRVPALVCRECGETSLDAKTESAVCDLAMNEIETGAMLEFCTFTAQSETESGYTPGLYGSVSRTFV